MQANCPLVASGAEDVLAGEVDEPVPDAGLGLDDDGFPVGRCERDGLAEPPLASGADHHQHVIDDVDRPDDRPEQPEDDAPE